MAGRAGKRKTVARKSSFRSVALLIMIPIAGFAAFLAFRYIREQLARRPAEASRTSEARVEPSAAKPAPRVAKKPEKEKPVEAAVPSPAARPTKAEGANIVLILDDVGFDNQPLAGAMRIDRNLNFSILPNSANAAAFAEKLHGAGFEVMCHLPMEPLGYPRESPGPNAIMTSMSDEEIAALTRQNIAAVPYATGVNNHMGSKASRDSRVMTATLKALPPGMFFIDSRTTSGSVGEEVARELKIPTGSRRVFLDDVQSESAVRQQLAALASDAKRDGLAIGIGHMYPVTIKVLLSEVPELRESGFRFVRASEAVR